MTLRGLGGSQTESLLYWDVVVVRRSVFLVIGGARCLVI